MPYPENTIKPDNEKVAQIRMSLSVENNNKFVRGKKKARENIENYLKYYYKMQKSPQEDYNYILFVEYNDIDDLKNTVYEIFREVENEADAKNCFIEGDASCDKLSLNW